MGQTKTQHLKGGVEIQTEKMKHALLWELHAITVENQTTMPKCASENHESQQIEAKETETTTQEGTDLVENSKIQKTPNIKATMHVMTQKEPASLGQDPQDEQNTSSIKIKAAITAPQMRAMTASQMKAMTAPQIVMMIATCST